MNKIEKIFFDAMNEWLQKDAINVNEINYQISFDFDSYYFVPNIKEENAFFLTFESQPKKSCFSGFIPDFAIYVNSLYEGFIIEIDGYEWHEKSKEQARTDKEKDRAYLKSGFLPIRFTGYEVYHNVSACIREVFEIISNNIHYFEYDSLIDQLNVSNEYVTHLESVLGKQDERLHLYESGKYSEKAFNIFKGEIELNPNLGHCI